MTDAMQIEGGGGGTKFVVDNAHYKVGKQGGLQKRGAKGYYPCDKRKCSAAVKEKLREVCKKENIATRKRKRSGSPVRKSKSPAKKKARK